MKALVSITPTLLPDLYHTDQLRRALGFVRPAVTRAISQASKTQLSCFLCGIKTCITGPGRWDPSGHSAILDFRKAFDVLLAVEVSGLHLLLSCLWRQWWGFLLRFPLLSQFLPVCPVAFFLLSCCVFAVVHCCVCPVAFFAIVHCCVCPVVCFPLMSTVVLLSSYGVYFCCPLLCLSCCVFSLLFIVVCFPVVHCCVCPVIVMMIVMTTMMTVMMMMMMMAEMTDDRQVYMNLSTEEESLYAEIDHHDERET